MDREEGGSATPSSIAIEASGGWQAQHGQLQSAHALLAEEAEPNRLPPMSPVSTTAVPPPLPKSPAMARKEPDMARKGISLRGLRRLMGTIRELCDGGRFGDGVTFDSLTMTQLVNGCADTCGNVDM